MPTSYRRRPVLRPHLDCAEGGQNSYAQKYWALVGRVDNVWGDRNLSCSCVPISAYTDAA